MKDYSTFEAADFVLDENFFTWVKHPDEKSNAFWNEWIKANPERLHEVEEAVGIIKAVITEYRNFPSEYQKQMMWSSIDQHLDEDPARTSTSWTRLGKVISLLLVAGIAAVTAVFIRNSEIPFTSQTNVVESSRYAERINNGSKPLTLILEDGSSIILQPNSTLKYPRVFEASSREVYLTGEAFFEITKDAQRPFLVYANDLVTRVLGTSFSIRAFDNEPNIVVEVRSGKVSVFSSQEPKNKIDSNLRKEGLVLTPNQQAVYTKEDAKLTKSLFENPTLLSIPGSKVDFEFVDATMEDVFNSIEEAYGVDIVYDGEVMKNCYLNASLTDESLQVKLALICRAVNATYEIMDTHIIIYGKGCD